MIKGKEDITDEEYEEKLIPLNINFKNYMIKFIIPEAFAFQLANSYHRDCLCDATFEQHFHSMCDVFNGFHDSIIDISSKTFDILKIKYNLVIIDDSPVKLEKWQ
ncbi:MAG: hypothetical protein PHF21_00145 [Bacilli bacterium]|nr:hypothetical protein [Bacilli bacterium]